MAASTQPLGVTTQSATSGLAAFASLRVREVPGNYSFNICERSGDCLLVVDGLGLSSGLGLGLGTPLPIRRRGKRTQGEGHP